MAQSETAHKAQQLDSTDRRLLPPLSGGIVGADPSLATGARLDEFLGHLLLICPLQHEEWDTAMGNADVIVSQILDVTYTLDKATNAVSASYEDMGETPVFWAGVKKQLDEQSTPEHPWVLGRLVKPGRAYKLDAPLPEDLTAANVALAQYQTETAEAF